MDSEPEIGVWLHTEHALLMGLQNKKEVGHKTLQRLGYAGGAGAPARHRLRAHAAFVVTVA
jgi:hypothetical protein